MSISTGGMRLTFKEEATRPSRWMEITSLSYPYHRSKDFIAHLLPLWSLTIIVCPSPLSALILRSISIPCQFELFLPESLGGKSSIWPPKLSSSCASKSWCFGCHRCHQHRRDQVDFDPRRKPRFQWWISCPVYFKQRQWGIESRARDSAGNNQRWRIDGGVWGFGRFL